MRTYPEFMKMLILEISANFKRAVEIGGIYLKQMAVEKIIRCSLKILKTHLGNVICLHSDLYYDSIFIKFDEKYNIDENVLIKKNLSNLWKKNSK